MSAARPYWKARPKLTRTNEWEPGASTWREAACFALEEEQVGDSEVGGYWNSFWSAVPVYNLSYFPPLTLDAWWVVECHWDCKQAQLTKMNFSNHPILSLPLVPLLLQDRQLLFNCWPLAPTHWGGVSMILLRLGFATRVESFEWVESLFWLESQFLTRVWLKSDLFYPQICLK